MMRRPTPRPSRAEAGFTIIELMIATLVFSVILTVITMGVLSFTNRYYKGVNASSTQNTARSILDTISQAIQFGSAPIVTTVDTGTNVFCAGGYSFTFSQGAQFNGAVGQYGLYMVPMAATCGATGQPLSGGTQLLANNMRITNLTVAREGTTRLYDISLSVAFGGDDLLCNLSIPNTCTAPGNLGSFWPVPNITCRSSAGSQFCATSTLKTTVAQRVGS